MAERRPAITRTVYARAVERRWRELVGGDALLSPRDWSRISDWFARGIPLGLIEEALSAPSGGRRRPRRLSAVAASVEQAWQVVLEGRLAEPASPAPLPSRRPLAWRARIELEPAGSPLARLLEELLTRHAAGEPAAAVDEALDRRLGAALPAAVAERVRREVEEELAPYRSRMSAAQLESTGRLAAIARARRLLGLPRLAGDGAAR